MSNVQVGPLLLNGSLIFHLVFGLGGWFSLWLWLRKRALGTDESRMWTGLYSNAFWVWLLVWKLSYAVFHFKEAFSYPMSFIYFDGGGTGVWSASVLAGIFLWRGIRKKHVDHSFLPGSLAIFITGGWFAGRLFVLFFGDTRTVFTLISAGLAGLLLLYFFFQKRAISKNMLVLVMVVGLAAYSVYNYANEQTAMQRLNQDTASQEIPIGIKKGQRAPDFILSGLDEADITLSDFRNNVVVLNFWASWCPPCRAEMPHMERLFEEYKDKGVVVLGVNLTSTEEGIETVRSFVRNEELSLPVALDRQAEVSGMYRIVSYPTTYIIDRQGVIRNVLPGAINFERLEKEIRGL